MGKSKKFFVSVLCIVLLGSLLIACTNQSTDDSESSDSQDESSSETSDTTQLKIATATTTGAFYPIGGVMASLLSENLDGYNFTAEATGGSQENARLIGSKSAHIAFFGSDTLYEAYHGEGDFEGDQIELAGLAKLYAMPFHIVTLKEKGIEIISDLEGKSVAVGAPGSGTSNKAEIFLNEHGLIFDENVDAQFLDFQEGSDALADGIVDAVLISVGVPSGNVQELTTSFEIDLVNFEAEVVDRILEKYPYMTEEVIPGGSYDGIDNDILTMGVPTELAVDPELDEELVYEIAKILYETHYDEFVQSHASMEDSTLELAPETSIPLHPGAEKFYKEAGVLD